MNMFDRVFRHDGWSLGIIRSPISALLDEHVRPTIAWLPFAKPHTFFADPFLIAHGGKTYCFFEELPYRSRRGHISYTILEEGAWGKSVIVRPAIERPFHLSYPFLVRYGDEIICIPEACSTGSVTAYAARAFPDGWYERATLLEGVAGVDPTVFEHEGRWWMFCTDKASAWNSELHAWYADDLFGRWRPHAANPIKRESGAARPGGTPFRHGGKLFRPTQDCSSVYGARLSFCEILELTPERFAEKIVTVFAPEANGPYPDGLHTASGCGDLTVVDGNRFYFEPYEAVARIAHYTRRAWLRVSSA